MIKSLDVLKEQGQKDIEDKTKEAVDKANAIRKDRDVVVGAVDGLSDDLESDILSKAKESKDTIDREATDDLENVKNDDLGKVGDSLDTITDEVSEKKSLNAQASSKLDSINSKYGREQISATQEAIRDNTKDGEELIKELEKAHQEALEKINEAKEF
ncbi:MAG: hypothetical protein ACOX1S_03940 [Anaerostipes sp.]|jgi:hypothetical protein